MDEANVHGTSGQPSTAPDASPESCHAQQQQVHRLDGTQEADRASEIAKVSIDTAAPIDSVKGAVNKFGVAGAVDWKEKRKQVEDELDQVQDEVTEYQKRTHEAEAGRARALQELGATVNAADELRLGLELARAEQTQARQQAELAEQRLEETRRAARERAKAELADARERRAAALAELRAARTEAEALEKVRARAAAEAGAAAARAREAAAASREAGNAVEGLAAELVALKRELEASRAAHVEAEGKRMGLAVAWEEDKSRWQTDLEDAELESKRLREHLVAACDVETKAEAASRLLASLKAELELFVDGGDQLEKPAAAAISTQQSSAIKKELADVKASVERAKDEAKCLRVAAASMRDELEKGKAELAALRRRERERREGLSSSSIPCLEEELRWVTAELAEALAKKAGGSEEAERVGEARREAEEAKAKARSAKEEVARARDDAGVAKAAVAAMEARLEAVAREILAANAAAELATASAGALLQQSKPAVEAEETEGVTLTMEEYEELSRRAQETEEAGGERVAEAVRLIKEAKDAEVRRLEKLARVERQTEVRRQALEAATLEAEEAEFDKLTAERELRQWRAEHDPTGSPRPGLAEISVLDDGRENPHIVSPRGGYMPRTELWSAADADADARQRKTFFPRIVMFLARKRAQSWSK